MGYVGQSETCGIYVDVASFSLLSDPAQDRFDQTRFPIARSPSDAFAFGFDRCILQLSRGDATTKYNAGIVDFPIAASSYQIFLLRWPFYHRAAGNHATSAVDAKVVQKILVAMHI